VTRVMLQLVAPIKLAPKMTQEQIIHINLVVSKTHIFGGNNMIEQRKLTTYKIVIYLIIFFAVWTIQELIVRPMFLDTLNSPTAEILGQAIKIFVWTLPAILLIRYFHADMQFGLKEMFITRPNWRKAAPFFAILLIPFLQALVYGGRIAISPEFEPTHLIEAVIFAGITEEIVFRGFLLNTFLIRMKAQQAIALDAVLFTLIHYPIWIYRGFSVVDFLIPSFYVIVLSVVFALSFIKSKNILIPMIIHMIWNLLVISLYMG